MGLFWDITCAELRTEILPLPYVTIKGLSYIDSVNQARALDIAKAAEAKSVSAMIKANKSFIVSVAALVATLIINLDKIVHNVKAILSYLSTL